MSVTRMKHEKHGFLIAYNNDEIAKLEKHGWSVEETNPPVVNQPVVNQPAQKKHKSVGAQLSDFIHHGSKGWWIILD